MSEKKKTFKNPISLQIDPKLFEKAGDEEKVFKLHDGFLQDYREMSAAIRDALS